MYTRIAVSVRDEDRAILRNGSTGRMVERRLPFRVMALAKANDRLAGEIERDNLMGVAIGDPNAIPGINRDPMRIEDFAHAIGSDERPSGS